MDVDKLARLYLEDVVTRTAGHPLPLYHRGEWWEYLGDRWGPLPQDTLDARLRLWLAGRKVNPRTALVNNLLAQVRAIVTEDHRRDMPCWLDGGDGTDPGPAAVVAFRNGLLDVGRFL